MGQALALSRDLKPAGGGAGPAVWSLAAGELALVGCSRAGEETWVRVSPPGLAFDAGRGSVLLDGVGELFLTHGHLDHALGLPFLLSRRSRYRGEATRVACPRPLVEPLGEFLAAAERLEGTRYRVELRGLDPGERVELAGGYAVRAFASEHQVPALGYELLRRRRQLLPQFAGAAASELAACRGRGEPLEEIVEEPWLAFCGDTGPGLFEREPSLYRTPVLLVECTFHAVAHRPRARAYGHLHLDDLVERAERFANELIVLHHLSRRHRRDELEAAVAQKLPRLAERICVVGD